MTCTLPPLPSQRLSARAGCSCNSRHLGVALPGRELRACRPQTSAHCGLALRSPVFLRLLRAATRVGCVCFPSLCDTPSRDRASVPLAACMDTAGGSCPRGTFTCVCPQLSCRSCVPVRLVVRPSRSHRVAVILKNKQTKCSNGLGISENT